ncbi:MAG: nickel/cobalt transporter [Pyrinomonadaceae bacterium]
MKKNFYISAALLIFALAMAAAAHPLGNFSVNQYSRLEVGRSQIKIRQILDVAEIPTFQLSSEIDTDKNGTMSPEELNAYAEKLTPRFTSDLLLTVNDAPVELRAEKKNISLREGAGNLPTMRVAWDLVGDLPNTQTINRVHFENKNYAERIGWNEIVLNRDSGINIFDATGYGSAITDEINSYPQETLDAPLREHTVDFSFTSGALPANARTLQNRDGHQTTAIQKDQFAELINGELTPSIILFGLLLAFGLGAIHALSPGHGKTVVGAYLVGSRGDFKHAVFLGLTVTITHTLGVFTLGLITLFASNYILPERLMPFLSFVSGLLVFFIGVSLFKNRLFGAFGWKKETLQHEHTNDEYDDNSSASDSLTHTHGGSMHTHLPPKKVSWKSLLALGISGGLLPCPSALVLMLSAISLGRIGYGIVLTLLFSLGLATTLTTIGLIFLYVGKTFGGSRLAENRLVKLLPVMSAFVIACVGAIICYQSI